MQTLSMRTANVANSRAVQHLNAVYVNNASQVDKIPFVNGFLEVVGLAVTSVYAYRYFTDPIERWVVHTASEMLHCHAVTKRTCCKLLAYEMCMRGLCVGTHMHVP